MKTTKKKQTNTIRVPKFFPFDPSKLTFDYPNISQTIKHDSKAKEISVEIHVDEVSEKALSSLGPVKLNLIVNGKRVVFYREDVVHPMKTDAKWVAHTNGGPNQRHWEIAVIREDFKHGFDSLGWFGEHKLLVSSSGGPSTTPVTELVWNELVAVAEKIAARLNSV